MINLLKITTSLFSLFIIGFYIFKLNSFIATDLALFYGGLYILSVRMDLFKSIFWTSLIFFLIAQFMFFLGNIFSPGVVEAFWDFSNLSGYKILGAPIEDSLFYLLLGFLLGGMYEYLFDFKIKDSSGNSLKKDLALVYYFIKKQS
ncbi:MAG: hypothetical protein COU40_03395 [Candidatus Moranbacteria bacterium CG10_big_fil_rev_8_21_14_0_10_35_21]|nr:MAG: hypothetical protein COU40_03395 [Candidatus Moranbacteria bacterium CG10_big_fil_rev_8_21_14_0_10_35_21]PJA88357.1 MAG: hypothetical protein CO139_03520 [Candidatus Moranbacteria bacterium CG_4_9_14_3_um_filter_36_9]